MRRPRFTIASLLGLVVFVAVSFAALREASDNWDSGVLAVTLILLLVSVLLAIHRTAARRSYWLGFALFGWAYLVASQVPPIESRLPTTKGLALIDSKLPGRDRRWIIDLAFPNTTSPNAVRAVAVSPQGNTLATS